MNVPSRSTAVVSLASALTLMAFSAQAQQQNCFVPVEAPTLCRFKLWRLCSVKSSASASFYSPMGKGSPDRHSDNGERVSSRLRAIQRLDLIAGRLFTHCRKSDAKISVRFPRFTARNAPDAIAA